MGSRDFSAQYQQEPVPEDGNLIRWSWFMFYDEFPGFEPNDRIVVSWDTAMSAKELSSFSVGVILVARGESIFVFDLIRDRFEYPDLKRKVIIDGEGVKHPLGLIEGATENTAVVQALIDNLVERGLDPAIPRLFVIDGAKALSRAIRRTFGRHTPIQRCQIHKARNIMRRLPLSLHASVRRVLRQAWELDDAEKAEKLRRLQDEAPGASASILEGLDEMLTVTRLGLPTELRRSLACTNIIENMMGTVRRVCRNVKRWRTASMALRWIVAAMLEAKKGFRKLKAYKQLPALRIALKVHHEKTSNNGTLAQQAKAA